MRALRNLGWLLLLLSAGVGAEPEWSLTSFGQVGGNVLRPSGPFRPVAESAGLEGIDWVAGGEIGLAYGPFHALIDGTIGVCTEPYCKEPRVRELYGDFARDAVNLTVGRRIVRWGTGYIDRPTSLLEGAVRRSDPEDWQQTMEGADTVLVEWFRGAGTFSLAWAQSDENRPQRDRPHWIARYAGTLGATDVALVAGVQKPEVGFSLARVFGDALELHADLSWQQATERQYNLYVLEDGPPQLFASDPNGSWLSDSGRFFLQSVVGGQLTIKSVNIILEWLHDGRGLTDYQFRRWRGLVGYHDDLLYTQPALQGAAEGNLLWDLDTLIPNGAMQDYGFLRFGRNTGVWRPEVSLFCNLHDGSCAVTPKLRLLKDKLDVLLMGQLFTGSSGSEFGINPVHWSVNLYARLGLF